MNETMVSAIRFALDIALKATLLFSFTAVVIGLLRRSGAAARHLAGTAGIDRRPRAAPPDPGPAALGGRRASRPVTRLRPNRSPLSRSTAPSAPIPFRGRGGKVGRRTARGKPALPSRPSTPRGRSVPWPLVALAAWTAGALLVGAQARVRHAPRPPHPPRGRADPGRGVDGRNAAPVARARSSTVPSSFSKAPGFPSP